jgi:hypothetical protein
MQYNKQRLFITFLAQLYYAELYVSWNTGINCCSPAGHFPLWQTRKRKRKKSNTVKLKCVAFAMKSAKMLTISFAMSVCPHVTTREPLNALS